MLILLRILFMLGVLAIGACVLLYLVKGERRYLHFAWLTGKVLGVLLLVFFGLLAVERLL